MFLFNDELYITVTGLHAYYQMKPFDIGTPLMMIKEPTNDYDDEAIMVLTPALGKVGYVANSPHTTAKGTMSAGRIYDKLPDECVAVVMFMTQTKVIARVLPDMKLKYKLEVTLEQQDAMTKDFTKTSLRTDFSKLF